MATPIIPEYITVHLGEPDDASAPNVRVPFIDYIKNVASSEIYPTWPEAALRANILAQISFAMNRIYTEWYRSRGYDFDITSSTRYDQKFIPDREIFDNIAQLVNDIFNDYVVREGSVVPLFAQYCSGTTVTCDGLSQWGTVDLAEQGLVPYEILQHYYGDNIGIVFNAPTGENLPSYPGVPLRLGSVGEEVRTLQRELNRIGRNYPAIGPQLAVDGVFNRQTEEAVRNFQQIFNLTVDGIVGKATWYRGRSIYNAVKGLSELISEGLSLDEVSRVYPRELRLGDTGNAVRVVQYYLAIVSYFDETLPQAPFTGTFDAATEAAVRAFQTQQGLTVDGVVGRETWNALTDAYRRTLASLPEDYQALADEIYPGSFLVAGQSGPQVASLQRLLRRAAAAGAAVPPVEETGIYDDATGAAVRAVQRLAGLEVNGIVGPPTWDAVARLAGG